MTTLQSPMRETTAHSGSQSDRRRAIDKIQSAIDGGFINTKKAVYRRLLWFIVIGGSLLAKRLFDIIVSLTAIILLIPVYIATAIAIYIDNPGPILFKQTRVGLYGRVQSL